MTPAAAEVAHHIGLLQGVQKEPVLCGFLVNIKISNCLNLVAHPAMQFIKHQYQIEHFSKAASTTPAEGDLLAQSFNNFLHFAVFKMSENHWMVKSLETSSI